MRTEYDCEGGADTVATESAVALTRDEDEFTQILAHQLAE